MRRLLALLVVLQASCAIAQVAEEPVIRYESLRHPVYSTTGMVTARSSVAAEIGAQVLADGGNAVDAAVAVGFSLAVTLPQAGNIGGGGFMLVYDADSATTTAIVTEQGYPAPAPDQGNDEATPEGAYHAPEDRLPTPGNQTGGYPSPGEGYPPPVKTELQATNPSTVNLASGELQLVEFFAFW